MIRQLRRRRRMQMVGRRLARAAVTRRRSRNSAASAAAMQGAIAQERAGMSAWGNRLRRARFASLALTPDGAAARAAREEAKEAKAAQVASEKAVAAASREAAKASRAEEKYHRAFPQERLHAARVASVQLPPRPAGRLRVGVAPLSLGARVFITIPTAARLVRF